MDYRYFHARSIGIFYFFPSNNLTCRFFGYIRAIILYYFPVMSTVVDGIAEGVQESPEKVDYSAQIKPEEMPETKRAQMEASRRLISILCEK